MKHLKRIPSFNSELEEQEFWKTHDPNNFIDWNMANKNPSFPALKPSSKTISIRLPDSLVRDLKSVQSLMKGYLSERVKSELG